MTNPDVGPSSRLYAMLQHLLILAANGRQHPRADNPRNVVSQEEALDAILQLAVGIDRITQAGLIPTEHGAFLGAALMVVRDHVAPLPVVPDSNTGADKVTPDLSELAEAIHTGAVNLLLPDHGNEASG